MRIGNQGKMKSLLPQQNKSEVQSSKRALGHGGSSLFGNQSRGNMMMKNKKKPMFGRMK